MQNLSFVVVDSLYYVAINPYLELHVKLGEAITSLAQMILLLLMQPEVADPGTVNA